MMSGSLLRGLRCWRRPVIEVTDPTKLVVEQRWKLGYLRSVGGLKAIDLKALESLPRVLSAPYGCEGEARSSIEVSGPADSGWTRGRLPRSLFRKSPTKSRESLPRPARSTRRLTRDSPLPFAIEKSAGSSCGEKTSRSFHLPVDAFLRTERQASFSSSEVERSGLTGRVYFWRRLRTIRIRVSEPLFNNDYILLNIKRYVCMSVCLSV